MHFFLMDEISTEMTSSNATRVMVYQPNSKEGEWAATLLAWYFGLALQEL